MTARTYERWARWLVIGVAFFVGLTALGGGVTLISVRDGGGVLPLDLLAHTPFSSFLVPGLLLAMVVGGSSLASWFMTWRRRRGAGETTLVAGGALTVWIVAEVAMLRAVHPLHVFYGVLGLVLLGFGAVAAARAHRARERWLVAVTLAEATGFMAPALAGLLSLRAGLGETGQTLAVVGAGFVEGLVLGAGQAWAFPQPVRRWRYALLTALGAGAVWAVVMTTMALVTRGPVVPVGLVVVVLVAAAALGLVAIGASQWIELRHHARGARRWIAWTALAWTAALPLSFLPGPFVDASTPLGVHVVLWASGGLLMAFVMALITWQGVRRLTPRALTSTPVARRGV